jgi:hypothetical protein
VSLLSSFTDESLAARRGVITLFAVAGGALAYWWREYGEPDYLRLVLGIACLIVAAGLWKNFRWARWLALGSCFLSIVIAFAMPVILALWKPFESYGEGATNTSFFTIAAAGAIAMIGYKGLGYFRSPAAWSTFSDTEEERKALAGESSLTVVKSAAVVAAVLGLLAAARGVGMPNLHSVSPKASENLPDLMIGSLCMSGINLVQAEVRNVGAASASGEFVITFTDLRGRSGVDESRGEVPRPGRSSYVVLDTATNQIEKDGLRLPVQLEVDSTHRIRESNESNNRAFFPIVFDYFYPRNLPACPGP